MKKEKNRKRMNFYFLEKIIIIKNRSCFLNEVLLLIKNIREKFYSLLLILILPIIEFCEVIKTRLINKFINPISRQKF